MALKTCLSYICNDSDQFRMEIRNTSSGRPRSVDNAELGHFTLLFCRGRQRNTKIFNARAQLLFCSLNLLLITRCAASYCWDLLAKCRNTVLVQLIAKTRKTRLVLHAALKTVSETRAFGLIGMFDRAFVSQKQWSSSHGSLEQRSSCQQ